LSQGKDDGVIRGADTLGDLVSVVQRETLRTRLLFALDEVYPKWLRTDVLHTIDRDIPQPIFDRELAYLEEKNLIQRKPPRAGTVWANKITARGRDFLDGHIQEVGLASPESCRGK
jgi:hypothetical protein